MTLRIARHRADRRLHQHMSTDHAFQPETVEALATAFHAAWRFLLKDTHFAELSQTVLQRRLSACLLQLAADGEHDPLRLANTAIERLRGESALRGRRQASHSINPGA
jgi:hypothetical protein